LAETGDFPQNFQKGNSFDCLSCRSLNQIIERLDLKSHVVLDYNLEEGLPPLSRLFQCSRQGLYRSLYTIGDSLADIGPINDTDHQTLQNDKDF
jgi:hypothetical protein